MSKFRGKVVFINDKKLTSSIMHSPYICVFDLISNSKEKIIVGIDRHGKEFKHSYSNNFIYNEILIMTEENQHHLFEDFIRNTFNV